MTQLRTLANTISSGLAAGQSDLTITPNGDQRGTDSHGNYWQYNNSTGSYWNTNGAMCWGKGQFRQCN